MHKPGKLQAVILMGVVVIASSCAATKEYTSKLFKPAEAAAKDSQAVALRFLELDGLDGDQENWVSTDIIKGKDSTSATGELDRLAEIKPATPDSTLLPKQEPKPVTGVPVARKVNPGEVREKRVRD